MKMYLFACSEAASLLSQSYFSTMRTPDLRVSHDFKDSSALTVSFPSASSGGVFAYLHAFSAETRLCSQVVVTEDLKN